MPLSILNSDWLSQNANRNYPFDDGATGISADESFTLPTTFMLDLVWPVHTALGQDPQRFYLRSLVSTGDIIIGSLAYLLPDGVTSAVVGSFTIPVALHTPGGLYSIPGVDEFQDSSGRVVIGNLEGVMSQGGVYQFNLEGSRLAPACIRPNLRGVSSIRVVTGLNTAEPMVGDIQLREGRNIRLTVEDGNTIRIDAISGAGLEPDCDCGSGMAIQTINGVPPDANGDFNLFGDECFDIQTVTAGLRFKDLCSQSCCGCEELTALTNDFNAYTRSLQQLESLISKLEGKVDTAMVNALASIVNDPNCGG
jgi:hypothetical protein